LKNLATTSNIAIDVIHTSPGRVCFQAFYPTSFRSFITFFFSFVRFYIRDKYLTLFSICKKQIQANAKQCYYYCKCLFLSHTHKYTFFSRQRLILCVIPAIIAM